MYTAQDALLDLWTIENYYRDGAVDIAIVALRSYLEEQKLKENIPELLRTKNIYPEM